MKYPIVTLCGSIKFEEEFRYIAAMFQKEGFIVLGPNLFSKSMGYRLSDDEIELFNDMHRQKIDMADVVYIINKNGYIGESTINEIKYAKKKKKPILYMEDNLYI